MAHVAQFRLLVGLITRDLKCWGQAVREEKCLWTHVVHHITLRDAIYLCHHVIGIQSIEQCLPLEREADLQIMGTIGKMFSSYTGLI